MKAIIPVAGKGTRLYPLGLTKPKAMLTVLNRPIIDWTLAALEQNGIKQVAIVISPDEFGSQIKAHLSSNKSLTIEFYEQKEQLGTAHVIQVAREAIPDGDEFIVIYGDDLYGPNNIKTLLEHKGPALLAQEVSDPEKWGIFQIDENNNLITVVEKPSTPIGNLANIGCVKLTSEIFDVFSKLTKSSRGEYELTDSINLFTKLSRLKVIPKSDYWLPIGYPWHLLDATDYLAPLITEQILGNINNLINHGKLILPLSSSIGVDSIMDRDTNLIIGDNTIIGDNNHFAGNVVIGNNTTMGPNNMIVNSIIGDNVKIASSSIIRNSIIASNTIIKDRVSTIDHSLTNKTVLSNIKGNMVDTLRSNFGAVIGENSLIKEGTIIESGVKIWPNSTTLISELIIKDHII